MNKNLGEKINTLKSQGKSNKEIQEILGCSKSIISYHTRRKYATRHRMDTCACGKAKSVYAERCAECENTLRREKVLSKTLAEVRTANKANRFSPFSGVRELARKILNDNNVEQRCAICGFSEYVEACHIKAIKDFPETATLAEVNDINNLVYLCPNHHILLDRGKLSVLDIPNRR